MTADALQPGQLVRYEVHNASGGSFAIDAVVVEDRGRRVLIRYQHWSDGREVESSVRPYRISRVRNPDGGRTAHETAHEAPDA